MIKSALTYLIECTKQFVLTKKTLFYFMNYIFTLIMQMIITFKDKEAMLYSIDMKNILYHKDKDKDKEKEEEQKEEQNGHELSVSWCFIIIHPPSITQIKTVSSINDGRVGYTSNSSYDKKTSDPKTESAKKNINDNTENTFFWEIRTVCPKGRKTVCSKGTITGICMGSTLQSDTWRMCRGHIPQGFTTLKGRIEIYAVCSGIIEKIEINNLEISVLSSTSITTSYPPCQYYPNITTTTTTAELIEDYKNNSILSSVKINNKKKSEKAKNENEYKNNLKSSIYHVGGDFDYWSSSVNRICSLRSFNNSSRGNVPRVPSGFSLARRLFVMENENTAKPYISIRFLAKLKKLRTRTIIRNDSNNNSKHDKYGKNEENENKLFGWGYEWRILIIRSTGSSGIHGKRGTDTGKDVEMLSQGLCEQSVSSINQKNHNNKISSTNNTRENIDFDFHEKEKQHEKIKDEISFLVPWTWSGITAELGSLDSGDEILLVTRPLPPQDPRTEIPHTPLCGVDVKDCEILYCHPSVRAIQKEKEKKKEKDVEEGRDEGKRDSDKMARDFDGDGDGSGTYFGTLKTGHFVIMNDQSLQLPCC